MEKGYSVLLVPVPPVSQGPREGIFSEFIPLPSRPFFPSFYLGVLDLSIGLVCYPSFTVEFLVACNPFLLLLPLHLVCGSFPFMLYPYHDLCALVPPYPLFFTLALQPRYRPHKPPPFHAYKKATVPSRTRPDPKQKNHRSFGQSLVPPFGSFDTPLAV